MYSFTMELKLKLCVFLLFYSNYLVSAGEDPCETRETCSKCITYRNCVWCAKAGFGVKCVTDNPDIQRNCEGDLQGKENNVEVTENKPYTSTRETVVQLRPQRIKIDLSIGQPTNFHFAYKQADNYPVDLYFLLDASFSMERVRDALITQSRKIYEIMHKFTTNIRLGIGTFVDKNILPSLLDPSKKTIYSFRHHLNLTDNVTDFNNILKGLRFHANYDSPEGGLDALAQVLACSEDNQNIIQWNKHTRKFVLFFTDDEFHAAGDGLIGGIHQPYDGKCYTTLDGIYQKELEMDYPSANMIYKLAKKIEANLIFIVEEEKSSAYNELNDYLGGILKTYQQYNSDSGTDFDDKLRQAYEDKTKYIKLKTSIPEIINKDDLKIDFTPDCSEDNFESLEACEIHENKEIKVTGTITLEKYYETSKTFIVDIVVNGINEKLQLDVNVITNCGCEKKGIVNATECTGSGTLVCGLCDCNKGRYGSKCLCSKPDDNTDLSSCKMNKDDDTVCSGNGKCECGVCKCDSLGGEQIYYGTFCQCNAKSCPIGSNGKQCSGNGECACGLCMCAETWTGVTCDTSTEKTNCLKLNKVCNGLGTCFNNTCVCDEVPEWDARQSYDKLCGILPETDLNQCKLLEKHARCAYDKESSCPNEDRVRVNLTNDINVPEKEPWKICDDVRVGPGCYIQFAYKYNEGERTVQLLVKEHANCQETYYYFGGTIFATLILVGICTLVGWKILTNIQDRKEYEEFLLSSNRKASIRKNVLYTSPKTTFDNPTYENKCD